MSAHLAARTHAIQPFLAVEVAKEAARLQAAGRDIISMGIGEPDFTAPPPVLAAALRAMEAGHTGYSAPAGLPALREAIAAFYADHFGAPVDPGRVIVTSGASGALLLAAMALVNPGDEILLPDPSYPANQNFIASAGGIPRLIPSDAARRFHLSAQDVRDHWTPATRGVLIASPSNPTGTSIADDELRALIDAVRQRNGFVIMDEIYLGLSYDHAPRSALRLDDNLIILNSFSKYFHMTGWRLGWMIVPEALVAPIERMAASLAICPPSPSQHAALACFGTEALDIFEARRLAFRQRRDFLLPAFDSLGLDVPVRPDGAFYIYTDISRHSDDSSTFAARLLHEAGVAAVPGIDFGPAHAARSIRFSYATAMPQLEQAIERMRPLCR